MNGVKKISIGLAAIAIVVALITIIAFSSSGLAAKEVKRGTDDTPQKDGRSATTANTFYEEITDFGLNPQTRELEAVISIKQLTGYNTYEHVSIWVDWNDNFVFEANELAGTTHIYVPNSVSGTYLPLRYSVSIKSNPPPGISTAYYKDRKARAILSEWSPATSPSANPAYGNVIDRYLKFDPIN